MSVEDTPSVITATLFFCILVSAGAGINAPFSEYSLASACFVAATCAGGEERVAAVCVKKEKESSMTKSLNLHNKLQIQDDQQQDDSPPGCSFPPGSFGGADARACAKREGGP